MIINYLSWKHVFKLDPERDISEEHLEKICMSSTDAIIVGGSSGVTYENTVQLLARVRRFEIPCVLEVSNVDAIVLGFDLYLIPIVLNAKHPDWIIGYHQQAIKRYGSVLNWDEIIPEGYIILNPQAKAAQVTHADTQLDSKDVVAYAKIADRLLRMPIVYIEYSGQFGDMELLAKVKDNIHQAQLFYGGGIDTVEKAKQAAAIADTIIVGNMIYRNVDQALETVKLI